MRKWITALLAVLMLWTACAGGLAEETAAPTDAPKGVTVAEGETVYGMIRVWLQSLGNRSALGLTLDGSYSVDGDRGFQFEPGTEISLGLDGGHIVLKAGGAAIDMGGGFSLMRHLDDDGNAGGVYIHESEKDTLYAGDVSFSARSGSIRVIVTVNIEDYLYGVVPYEMSDTFPLEALKAQAVAARTYAMQRRTRNITEEYDVVDTANDQVYKGLDTRFERPIQAVNETQGIVGLLEDGAFAECFYSASNGGQTALATDVWGRGQFDYLDIRDDPYDLENPESIVKSAKVLKDANQLSDALHTMLVEGLAAELQKTGVIEAGEAVGITELVKVEAVEPVYGGGSRQFGTVRFTVKPVVRRFMETEGDANATRMLGDLETLDTEVAVDLSFYDQVRQVLGIGINASPYDMLEVTGAEDGFILTTRRYGHGVGLSQRGAQQMANAHGKTYLEILDFYYPGLSLVHLNWMADELTHADALPESLGYAAARPTPAPTPAPLPALSGDEYYAKVNVEGVDSTLNVRGGPSTVDAIVGVLRNGARLIVEEETAEGWAKMKTAELEGYVLMSFIAKE